MNFQDKDLFLILTVVAIGLVVYLIVSLTRKKKAEPATITAPKRIERIASRPTEPAPLKRSQSRPEPKKIPSGALLSDRRGRLIGAVRRTHIDFVDHFNFACNSLIPKEFSDFLDDRFKLDDDDGLIVYGLSGSGHETIDSITIVDQNGEPMNTIGTTDKGWRAPEQRLTHPMTWWQDRLVGLYRRHFLQAPWTEQSVLMRIENGSLDTLQATLEAEGDAFCCLCLWRASTATDRNERSRWLKMASNIEVSDGSIPDAASLEANLASIEGRSIDRAVITMFIRRESVDQAMIV